MKNLRTALRRALLGDFRRLRELVFPHDQRYKTMLELAMNAVDIRRGDVGISRIRVLSTPTTMHYFIRLSRPGIFIGRKGKTLNGIIADLESVFHKTVKIHLKDFDPFWD